MPSPSQRRRRPTSSSQPRSRRPGRPPQALSSRRPFVGLWLLCGLLYGIAGMLLTELATPWLWLLAAAGAVMQGLALAVPKALQQFRWLTANLLVLGSISGSTMLAVALSIAFNHLGTDNVDDMTIASGFIEVVVHSLLAVGLTVLCSLTTSALGDRMLRRHTSRFTSLGLIVTGLVGLAVGGGLGLLI